MIHTGKSTFGLKYSKDSSLLSLNKSRLKNDTYLLFQVKQCAPLSECSSIPTYIILYLPIYLPNYLSLKRTHSLTFPTQTFRCTQATGSWTSNISQQQNKLVFEKFHSITNRLYRLEIGISTVYFHGLLSICWSAQRTA